MPSRRVFEERILRKVRRGSSLAASLAQQITALALGGPVTAGYLFPAVGGALEAESVSAADLRNYVLGISAGTANIPEPTVFASTVAGTSFTGAHVGDGSALTALNASNVSSGTLADARLSGNVLLATGSYANPAWITSLAWSKISGTPTTLAGYGITDGVPTSRTLTVAGTAGRISSSAGAQSLAANRTWTLDLVATAVSAASYGSATQVATFTVDTYGRLTAASSVTVTPAWASITSKPTTIAGYGITDFNSLGDARWSLLAHTHTFASITSKPTTIAGYGITDFNSLGDARWVQLAGSYSNPAWITALAGSKITGNITGNAANVTGTVAIANGGTGATTAAAARTALGATTLGANLFTFANPSAIRFIRINADNTVTARSAADFLSDIGAGSGGGTVSSVDTAGAVSGLTLTGGPITSTGTITLGGTLTLTSGQVTTALGFTPPSTTGAGASGSWGISITGSAATLTTPRTLWGNSFNGSANVENNLLFAGTGSAIGAAVRAYGPNNSAASLTANALTGGSHLFTVNGVTALTVTAAAVTASSFVGALSGNATTATALQTTRTIWGQNFNGSANVTGALSGATTINASGTATVGALITDGLLFQTHESTVSIPVSSPGWYRVGTFTATGTGRGAVRIILSSTGGSFAPTTYIIDAYAGWSTGIFGMQLRQYGNVSWITAARIAHDGGDRWVEVQFINSVNAITLNYHVQYLQGYLSSFTRVAGGVLTATTATGTMVSASFPPAGGTAIAGDIRAETGFISGAFEAGSAVVNGMVQVLNAGTQQLRLRNTLETVDQRQWEFRVESAGNLHLRSTTDSGTTVQNPMTVNHATGQVNFSAAVNASILGNAATVTNGVYTTGSYADPAWITSLAASKITGTLAAPQLFSNGAPSAGHTAVVGATQHTDAAALHYRAYLAYDAYWNEAADQWEAVRTTLGRKWMTDMSYHANQFRVRYFDGTVSAPWADSAWSNLFTVNSVGAGDFASTVTSTGFFVNTTMGTNGVHWQDAGVNRVIARLDSSTVWSLLARDGGGSPVDAFMSVTTTAGGAINFSAARAINSGDINITSTTAEGLQVYRNSSGANSSARFRTTAGSVYAGYGTTATFAVKGDANLAASPWFAVSATAASFAGTLDFLGFVPTDMDTHNTTVSRQFAPFASGFQPANRPASANYFAGFSFRHNLGGTYVTQMAFGASDVDPFSYRYFNNTSWSAWRTVLSSQNFNSYAPTLTGTGASGSWGISITGSSASTTGNAATATNLSSNRTFALTGDATGSVSSNLSAGMSIATTIAAGAVTLAKMANIATSSIIGRLTAGTGVPQVLTAANVRTIINVANGATANDTDAALRARASHTGTQTAATISDFSTAVAATAAVTANTAKVTNATHTGDVTGATALTIANAVVTYAKIQNVAANSFLANVTGGAATVQAIATSRIPLFAGAITGTPSGTTYLRGDGVWAALAGGSGDVVGPASSVDGEVAIYNSTTGKILMQSGITTSVPGFGANRRLNLAAATTNGASLNIPNASATPNLTGFTNNDIFAENDLVFWKSAGATAAERNPLPRFRTLTSGASNSTTTMATLTDLSFSVGSPDPANATYYFRAVLLARTSAGTNGIRVTMTYGNATAFSATARAIVAADGASGEHQGAITSSGDAVIFTAMPASATDYVVIIEGIFVSNGSAATVAFQYASETTGTVTVAAGSHVQYGRIR